jgi:hypothetical protein
MNVTADVFENPEPVKVIVSPTGTVVWSALEIVVAPQT